MFNASPAHSSDPASHGVACSECGLDRLCLPLGVDAGDLDRLDGIIRRRRPLRRGEYLFHAGDPFTTVYAVRSGSIKTFSCTADGVEHVTGFYLPGELVGLDAIAAGTCSTSARVLETSSICEVDFEDLATLSMRLDGLQRRLLSLMSREISRDQQMMTLLANMAAEQRLAALLHNLATRFGERGFSSRSFRLSMSRNDIGSYLGLAVETVSRQFTRLQADGLLSVERRQIHIHDMPRLARIAGY